MQAGVATSGKADSFLKAAHITRTRRARRVTACVLHQALEEAHQEHVKSTEPNTEPMSLEDWCTVQQESQPMFEFWFLVLQLQLTILVFVRSIRSRNFPLYNQSLTKLVHGFFTFDHYHYARLISVHLRDMMALSHLHPDIHTYIIREGTLHSQEDESCVFKPGYRPST